MSVLINMEMPSCCYDCELIDIVKGCPHYEIPSEAYCQIPWIRKRRAEGCPLVRAPEHGRLIDADGEMHVILKMMPGGKCDVKLIAPTIIPEEEGAKRT